MKGGFLSKVRAYAKYKITAITAKQLSTVYHIGSLKRPSKKSFSLEGAGVSVSVDPLAWSRIVKLGGHDVWKLEKANPKFLMWSESNSDILPALKGGASLAEPIFQGST